MAYLNLYIVTIYLVYNFEKKGNLCNYRCPVLGSTVSTRVHSNSNSTSTDTIRSHAHLKLPPALGGQDVSRRQRPGGRSSSREESDYLALTYFIRFTFTYWYGCPRISGMWSHKSISPEPQVEKRKIWLAVYTLVDEKERYRRRRARG